MAVPLTPTPAQQRNPIKATVAEMAQAEEKQPLTGKEGRAQQLSRKPDGLKIQETISLDGK